MTNPRGRVISLTSISASPHALVEVDDPIRCPRCAEGKGCGAGVFGGSAGTRRINAKIGVGVTVHEGDEVRIALEPARILHASLSAYGLPLGGAVIGAMIASAARLGDFYAAMLAVCGLAGGIAIARVRLRQNRCQRLYMPTIVECLPVNH